MTPLSMNISAKPSRVQGSELNSVRVAWSASRASSDSIIAAAASPAKRAPRWAVQAKAALLRQPSSESQRSGSLMDALDPIVCSPQ